MARKSRKDAAAQAKLKKTGMKICRAALYIRLADEVYTGDGAGQRDCFRGAGHGGHRFRLTTIT